MLVADRPTVEPPPAAPLAALAPDGRPVPALSLGSALLWHLLPGAAQLGFTLAAAPLVQRLGFPPRLAHPLVALLVTIPLMAGILLRQARRRNGSFALRGIVLLRERLPLWQYAAICLPLVAWAFVVLALVSPLGAALADGAFGWLPAHLRPSSDTRPGEYARAAILATLVLTLFVDGLLAPVTEEFYFRGYLLPRLWPLRWFAPAANAALFTLFHFWQPYNYLLILLVVLPEVYAVWWKRSLWIAVVLHCFGNTLGATLTLVAFLTGA
jgi:membrane protease YdiL (CAAX protease family)